ncbi:MAG: hypothetical protein GX262_03450 [Clostridia bacterium]|nr:hypothetical protein [Clostridia bacterium]
MWKQKIGDAIAASVTALFVGLGLTMVVSTVFLGLFLFTQAAWAADVPQGNDYCFNCHGQEGMSIKYQDKEISLAVDRESFENSVHGKLNCTMCHTGTDSFPHKVQYGPEFKEQMADSCSKCHQGVTSEFENSIHGQMGGFVSCTSCHGSAHEILKGDNPKANHYRFNITETCGTCHRGMVIESYERSFHGIALAYEYDKAPSCIDCHSSHNILPPENPSSTISAANIGSTCEPCHTGMINAGANLLNGKQHTVPEDKENGFPLWITWKIFLGLILFDVVMNGTIPTFELFRHLRNLKSKRKDTPHDLNKSL